ncbi:hypothetical protein D9758_000591 [Tetrapyrgos nigripes]|uniref:SAP domain-containing protein n=1 Tax=Tetrapyrgos nigripes TaxID=182062 RepID=A0A8H5LXD8_9AGAR|nr:hypothetical protein D9758_000591 [Tetrapyrgos nigripes]
MLSGFRSRWWPLSAEALSDLKNEARNRGLSPSGNKAKLIVRLQQHDQSLLTSSASTSQQSAPAPPQGDAPGVPHPPAPSSPHLNIVLPNLSEPLPEPAVQIPYVPDFWNSATAVEQQPIQEDVLPKLVVIAGDNTHLGGGPSHNLLDESVATVTTNEASGKESTPAGQGGLFEDMAEDIGMPVPKVLRGWFSRP